MNCHTLCALALTALTFAPAFASAQTTLTGTWELTMTTPQGPNTVEVNVTQTGEAITGELISPLGNAPFKGTFIKDVLSVTASVDMQGTPLAIVFDGKLTGETLAGTVKFGDFGEAPWTGKRKPAGAAAAPATTTAPAAATTTAAAATTTAPAGAGVSGKWNIQIDLPGNPIPITATLKQDGTAVTGTFVGPQGEIPVTGTMTGTTLKLDLAAPGGMNISMTGELGPDGLKGKTVAAGLGEMDWTGKRAN